MLIDTDTLAGYLQQMPADTKVSDVAIVLCQKLLSDNSFNGNKFLRIALNPKVVK
jgi:hypothetical protein